MIVSFSVTNFRSFREKATWSLVASAADATTREDDNVVALPAFGLRLLKSAVVYGANASGKTKLIEALIFSKQFILTSSSEGQADEPIDVEPFLLNPTAAQAPSEFEYVFIEGETLYRYGFEVSKKRVEAEWLFRRAGKKPTAARLPKETEVFYRTGQEIDPKNDPFNRFAGRLFKEGIVRENALLFSVAAQFNQPEAKRLRVWFRMLAILSGLDDSGYWFYTIGELGKPERKPAILRLLNGANFDIEDVREAEDPDVEDASDMPEKQRKRVLRHSADVYTRHRAYNDHREAVEGVDLSLGKQGSAGTKKFIGLTGPLLDVLENGRVFIVDELDSRLHPNLLCQIVHQFNSREGNPHNAQLLFNTHDTNLLAEGHFRRDQIWFTEKNRYGESTLYSLADFKTDTVRKASSPSSLERNYVRGKYGAVPYLGDFHALPGTVPESVTAPADEDAG